MGLNTNLYKGKSITIIMTKIKEIIKVSKDADLDLTIDEYEEKYTMSQYDTSVHKIDNDDKNFIITFQRLRSCD